MIENQEITKAIEAMINSPVFKWSVGTIITTLTGWALVSIKNTNSKIKNSISKEELAKSEDKLKLYTDEKIKIHEEKQVLELLTLTEKISETHSMVGKLLDIQLKK